MRVAVSHLIVLAIAAAAMPVQAQVTQSKKVLTLEGAKGTPPDDRSYWVCRSRCYNAVHQGKVPGTPGTAGAAPPLANAVVVLFPSFRIPNLRSKIVQYLSGPPSRFGSLPRRQP